MPTRILLDQNVFVAYGQIYVESTPEGMTGDMEASFSGQQNGLCGATIPGLLFLMTGGEGWHPLSIKPGDYRVRYHAYGMDRADEDPTVDRYLLQLWPAPPAPDRVLRETSKHAAYWQNWAQKI
jgi:hypothetical protein